MPRFIVSDSYIPGSRPLSSEVQGRSPVTIKAQMEGSDTRSEAEDLLILMQCARSAEMLQTNRGA